MNLKQLLNLREQAYKLRTEDKLEDSLEKYKEISTSSIQHENNQTFFFISEAKFNIATILEDLKKLDEAKDIYIGLIDRLKSGVDNFNKEKDLMELYAKVLINLGGLNFDGNFFLEASRIYNCVQKKYSKDCYANSRVQLGNINYILDMKEKAIGYYTQVEKTDSLRQYSRAQYGLGVIAQENNNLDRALDFYENVHNCAPAEIFYDAKNKAGQINYILNKYKEAKGFFSFIDEKSGIDIYGSSLFYLGKMSESTDEKNKYFERIDEKSQVFQQREYEINLVKKISLLEMDSIKNCFNNILDMVDIILEHLFISSESERLLAHYTNLTVSKLLLKLEYKSNPISSLRLNTVNLMNDPKEGLLLNNLLGIESTLNTVDLAFISCFTLHHDSLNQFRLYAKEVYQEATGLSLVLSKDFFAKTHNTANVIDSSQIKKIINSDEEAEKDSISVAKDSLSQMPVYRCVYFDPTSGLLKVAQREEWSFRREFKLGCEHSWFDKNIESDEKWKEYEKKISEIENNVKDSLKELSVLVKDLDVYKLDSKQQELIAEILLPLRYLMKHMAFKEEQECRIVYVTQMDNPLIQYDEKINRIYIDYAPSVMEHLEKIYIAPKAKDEKMVFEYLCSRGQEVRKGKPLVKVKISQNPFR